ncbi:glycosyltransferase family 4 protein [Candidatus Gracilibacteria bacterium]|nr:glycosyltransferase family 4 protein [Candidatus Gracilibacteria bacterium]
MHILFLADCLDDQGAGIHVYGQGVFSELVKLAKQDQGSKISVIRLQQPNHEQQNAQINSIVVPDYNWLPGYTTFRKFFLLPFLINRLKPDYLWEPTGFAPPFVKSKIAIITTVHDLTPITHGQFHLKMPKFWFRNFLPASLRRSNFIFVPSHSTKKAILDYLPDSNLAAKIKVIPLGTDFSGSETPDQVVVQKYQLKKPYLLYLGTIEPRKNLQRLLKAFNSLSQTKPDLELLLVGANGWLNKSFWKLYHQLANPSIRHLGYVPRSDLPTLITKAQALVYPSCAEGFGLPVLEGLRFGKPVIASDLPVHRELAADRAIYFNPKSTKSLLNAFFALETTNDPLEAKMRQNRASQFTWANYLKEVLKNDEIQGDKRGATEAYWQYDE